MAALACALTFSSAGLRVGLDGCGPDGTPLADVPAAYEQLLPLRQPILGAAQAAVLADLEPVVVDSVRKTIADSAYEDLASGRVRVSDVVPGSKVFASTGRAPLGGVPVSAHASLLESLGHGANRVVAFLSPWADEQQGADEQQVAVQTARAGGEFVGPLEGPLGFVGPRRPWMMVKAKHPLPFEPLEEAAFLNMARPPMFAAADEDFHTVPIYVHSNYTIRKGQTVSDLLAAAGIRGNEADQWISAARGVYNINRVYVGQQLSLVIDGPTNEMVAMELEIGTGAKLIAELEDGRIVVRRDSVTYTRDVRAVSGTITTSLYDAALAKGVPEKVVSDVAEILGWELNFARDLRRGATFKIVYEEMTAPGGNVHYARRVLAVEIGNRGRHYEGFYYADTMGSKHGYYDRSGKALGRYFLRYPVAFSRISSRFSRNRFHPITKKRQPHYGVDFAAPTGTPVRAVASGTVLRASWYRGNGRFVKLRHNSVYETGYSHLSRIARSVHAGGSVKKGQIIGYVGSTGLATGPHLHFALYRNQHYVDPLKADLPRADALSGAALVAHKINLGLIDMAYNEAARDPDGSVVMAALADVAAKHLRLRASTN